MTELPSAPSAAEPLVYRPLSGLALLGIALSLLFVGLVAISTLVALVQGLPVFLPGWVLGLAVVAACVCFLAQWRIRNSEGILAGLALARWGLWLSVLLGVTYFVYTWVTGLALTKQANDFLMIAADDDSGFFPRLTAAAGTRKELYHAFLLSLPATSRGGSKADNEDRLLFQYDQPAADGEPGSITKFFRNPLVLALVHNPKADIEPLGVVEWKYEKNSYHVLRNYRFTTAEMTTETPIQVQSTEGSGEGEQRKWFFVPKNDQRLQTIKLTPLGEKLLGLRFYSKLFLERWRMELAQGAPVPAYNESDTDWSKIFPTKAPQRDHIKKELRLIFQGKKPGVSPPALISDDLFAPWSVVDGRIQIVHSLKWMLPAERSSLAAHRLDLECVVASKEPIDLTAPVAASPAWELKKISVQRAAPVTKMPGPG